MLVKKPNLQGINMTQHFDLMFCVLLE